MTKPRILVAGIGNVFMGDDAFGVVVAQLMARRALPEFVRVVDFGIRSYDLAYALMDDYDEAILVDAAARGGAPGTLYTIDAQLDASTGPQQVEMDAHTMNPVKVLEMVRAMGGEPKRVLVVGCEPATLGDELEGAMGLSPPVEAAVERAIQLIESLVAKIVDDHHAYVVN